MSEELLRRLRSTGGEAELWELLESMKGVKAEVLGRALWDMRTRGIIDIHAPSRRSFAAYLSGPVSWWLWLYIAGAALGLVAAFLMPKGPPEVEFVRVIMGAPSLFYLPGYGLLKALYPERRWGSPEEAAISISLSLAILPLVGLALVYTVGLTLYALEAVMVSLCLALGLVAAYRRMPYEVGVKPVKS